MISNTSENQKSISLQLANHAVDLARKGEFEDAIKQYQEAITLDPNQPVWVYQGLANQLLWNGYAEEAVQLLDDAIKRFSVSDQSKLYIILGGCYNKLGDYENAINNYEKVFRIELNQPLWIYLAYARLLTNSGKLDQSLIVLNQLVNSYPDSADGFALLGVTLAKVGNLQEAISANKKAIELALEKNKSNYYLQLAKLLFKEDSSSVEAEIAVSAAIKFISEENVKVITAKLFSHVPTTSLVKILSEAMDSSDSLFQDKAIRILASRSLAHRIRCISSTNIQSAYEIKNQIKKQLFNIVHLASDLDYESQLELFILLSFLGFDSLKDYYINSLSQFIPKLSLRDFALVYSGLTSTYAVKLAKEIIKPTTILKIVAQSLTNEKSTEETAVIYSMLCFLLGQQEQEVLVLEKFLKDKGINLKDRDSSHEYNISFNNLTLNVNYRESLKIALDFRLQNNANLQEIEDLFSSRINPNKNYCKLIQRHPKVALCISGQLRGYKKAYPSIKKFIVDKLDADVFVHTWEDIGYKEPVPGHANHVFSGNFLQAYQKSLIENISYNELKQRFPSIFIKLSSQGKADLNSLKQFFETDHVLLEDDHKPEFKDWTNLKKWYYKIYKCSQLRESYYRNYDLVINIRPDLPIVNDGAINWSEICQKCNSQTPIIYSLSPLLHTHGIIVSDLYTISNPELSLYELIFPTEAIFKEKGLLGNGLIPHFAAGNRAWMTNTKVIKSPLVFGKLQRPTLTNKEIFECLNIDIQQRQVTQVDQTLLTAIQLDLETDQQNTK